VQRFSVSVDDDLAEWIESKADERGVSKAQIFRDSVETAMHTGLVKRGESDIIHTDNLLERIETLESRVESLEVGDDHPSEGQSGGDHDDVISMFRAQLEGRPPTTEHGEDAVVRVFELLVENGPMRTKELRETLYPEFEDEFASAESMWQSTQRHFDSLTGIEKAGHGKWDADVDTVAKTPD